MKTKLTILATLLAFACFAQGFPALDSAKDAVTNNSPDLVGVLKSFKPNAHSIEECVEYYEWVLNNTVPTKENLLVLVRFKREWTKLKDLSK